MIVLRLRVWLMMMTACALMAGVVMAEEESVEPIASTQAERWRAMAVEAVDGVKFDGAWVRRVMPGEPGEQAWLAQAFTVDQADLRSQMIFPLALAGDHEAVAAQIKQIEALQKQIFHEDFQDELKWVRMFTAAGAGDDAKAAREIAGMIGVDDQAGAHASRAYLLHQAGKKQEAARVITAEVMPRLLRLLPNAREGGEISWVYASVLDILLLMDDLAGARRVYAMQAGMPEQASAAILLGLYEKAAGNNDEANQLLGFADAWLTQLNLPPGDIDADEVDGALTTFLAYHATRIALDGKTEEAHALRARLKHAEFDVLNSMWFESYYRLKQNQPDEANRVALFTLKMIDEKLADELTFERMYFGVAFGSLLVRTGYARANAETLQKMFADHANNPVRQLLHAGLLVGIATEMTRQEKLAEAKQ